MQFFNHARIYLNCAAFIALTFLVAACTSSKSTSPEAKLAFDRVIPKPLTATAGGKTFLITENTTIVADANLSSVAGYLAETLKTTTGRLRQTTQ